MTTATDASELPSRDELERVVDLVVAEAKDYLRTLDQRPALSDRVEDAAKSFDSALPEVGSGAAAALRQLLDDGIDATVATSGPRCYHFVIGGVTPAALGADWIATLLDQPAYAWVSSPLGVKLEKVALEWLKDLFGLPRELTGIMTTGATMANFVGLCAARQWWADGKGIDVAEDGFAALPKAHVLSSGYVHASAVKCMAMLGLGRSSVRKLGKDAAGRLDLDAFERALAELEGERPIVIANAGEVNAGDFDPIARMADLAERYGAWLHVDGAFGLFARVSPRTAYLADGVERAHSVCVDGHKWLNVPYDCGFAFVRDATLLARAFAYTASYLPDADDPRANFGAIGPESSRRARALAVWATLRAYGRTGHRKMVEGHLDLAQQMKRLVDAAPELERLAEVPLNIVCFRYNPGSRTSSQLDVLNTRLGERILEDGRVYAGTTTFEGKVALRPAIVNWRTRPEDIDAFVATVRELANGLE